MSKLIEAAEAAVGALDSYIDRKEGRNENADGLKAIRKNLTEAIRGEKRRINLGEDVYLSGEEFNRRLIDKIPNFNELVVAIRKDVQAGR